MCYLPGMALLNIASASWQFDDQSNEVIGTFTDTPAANNSDPASWSPTKQYVVRFTVLPPVVEEIPPPEEVPVVEEVVTPPDPEEM